MKKFILYAFSFLGAGLPYQIFADDINESPNILIFIADDLGWEEVGVYGHPVVDTPNIDWLAYHGIRFNNFFLTASSSSPSRSSILTGMYQVVLEHEICMINFQHILFYFLIVFVKMGITQCWLEKIMEQILLMSKRDLIF